MTKPRLTMARSIATLAASLGLCMPQTWAQEYPAKPIRMVVGFAAGGATDFTARLIAQKLSDSLGKSVVVENRTGAGGVLATEYVARSPADGYTLLLLPSSGAIDAALRAKLPYNLERDFAPVSLVAIGPYFLAVHPSVPARDVKSLIALARSRPGNLTYGSAGVGSAVHLAAELFIYMADVKMLHVPYKGGSESVVATASGEVDASIVSIPAGMPLLKGGKLRALAVTSARRAALMPSLPTLSESGLTGYDRVGWFGVIAPAGVPPRIIGQLNAAIQKAVESTDMKESLHRQGFEPQPNTPEQFSAFIKSEIAQIAKLIRLIGLRSD